VEWHEVKVGLFYLQEQAGQTAGGRGLLNDKVVVCWQGAPGEVGRRLHWEAQRRGLGRARWILVVGDGAPWIWNVAADRWASAEEVLDFYHASEHLWELGRALFGEDEARAWVESGLHELRHGQEEKFLARVAELKVPRGSRRTVLPGKPSGYTTRQSPSEAGRSGAASWNRRAADNRTDSRDGASSGRRRDWETWPRSSRRATTVTGMNYGSTSKWWYRQDAPTTISAGTPRLKISRLRRYTNDDQENGKERVQPVFRTAFSFSIFTS
jgi:hypothetical protein